MTERAPILIRSLAYGWMIWLILPLFLIISEFIFKFPAARAVFEDPRFWSAFWISLISALAVVVISAIFAVPAAYFLAYRFRNAHLLETLMIDIPQTLPPIAVGVIYLFIFGPGSPINLAFTFAAVIIAKLVVSSPFALAYTLRRFQEIKSSKLDLIARSLGADTNDVLFRVLIPLSKRDIATGLTLCWSRAMGEFGGSLIFAGVIAYKTEILPTYTNRVSSGDPALALAATAVMAAFALIALVTVKSLALKKER
ncbi:MAG: ABC transporter permease subunit [Candidatus Colwellbacteria bacterium]|nr:ABC transporter permease subunit [Candidatus Colwellbacteria bacterium]